MKCLNTAPRTAVCSSLSASIQLQTSLTLHKEREHRRQSLACQSQQTSTMVQTQQPKGVRMNDNYNDESSVQNKANQVQNLQPYSQPSSYCRSESGVSKHSVGHFTESFRLLLDLLNKDRVICRPPRHGFSSVQRKLPAFQRWFKLETLVVPPAGIVHKS